MIWLLPPSPSSPVSKSDRRYTGRLRKRDNLLTGEGVGGRSRTLRRRKKPCPLQIIEYSMVRTIPRHPPSLSMSRTRSGSRKSSSRQSVSSRHSKYSLDERQTCSDPPTSKSESQKILLIDRQRKCVLLHNGGSCNACTIKRSIT
jgi:hypothetical protein